MPEIFDEYGNYIFPTDVTLDKPNIAISDLSAYKNDCVIGMTYWGEFVKASDNVT